MNSTQNDGDEHFLSKGKGVEVPEFHQYTCRFAI